MVIAELCPVMAAASLRTLHHSSNREVLLCLSRVYKELRRFKDEMNDDEGDSGSACLQKSCSVHIGEQSGCEIDCLADITSTMVIFLGMENKFVQHLAGNILVTFSNLLQDDQLVKFLYLLWIALEAAIIHRARDISSSPLRIDSLTDQHCVNLLMPVKDLKFDASSFVGVLQSKHAGANSLMIVGLFRCLRNIHKSLKHGNRDTKGAYVHLALSHLTKVPESLLIQIFLGSEIVSEEIDSAKSLVFNKKKLVEDQDTIILGAALQFLCSLVDHNYFEDAKCTFPDKLDIPSKCRDLVFKILTPLLQHLKHYPRSLSLYLRHKVLMLMIRMSLHLQWLCCNLVSCLKLLQSHFGDLLYECISDDEVSMATPLDESPFLASFEGDKVQTLSTRHLQRQATYLFLRYCLKFACFRDESALRCSCAAEARSTKVCGEHCDFMGLFELFEWLQRCALLGKIEDYAQYHKSCYNFALSFLQLYMEEDDLLFHLLLQLHDVSYIFLQGQNNKVEASFGRRRMDVYFHISSFFNPILLFHLFLLLLHYDHLVLADYLISNDIGIQFLHYLLRTLRIICKSWHTFVNFSILKKEMHQQCFKRRKNLDMNCTSSALISSSNLAINRSMASKGVSEDTDKMVNLRAYENAKDCLLSLKRMVEDLHRKNLFPYNPNPLLKSFTKFEELCMAV